MAVRIEDLATRFLDSADRDMARYQRIGYTGELSVMQVNIGAADFADEGSKEYRSRSHVGDRDVSNLNGLIRLGKDGGPTLCHGHSPLSVAERSVCF
jgi:hypothetical protein